MPREHARIPQTNCTMSATEPVDGHSGCGSVSSESLNTEREVTVTNLAQLSGDIIRQFYGIEPPPFWRAARPAFFSRYTRGGAG